MLLAEFLPEGISASYTTYCDVLKSQNISFNNPKKDQLPAAHSLVSSQYYSYQKPRWRCTSNIDSLRSEYWSLVWVLVLVLLLMVLVAFSLLSFTQHSFAILPTPTTRFD
ncbi:hypothetical protein Pcinc_010781 [Petrolisthes cinctipes]|uniref:Uncharacterized protein n=1 Tax=Petrolisthes cinctipes TaxID=88211 RepID=A0AAE1G218_PETCI|nr:hypothetical protein Pcinc_010781 [Petrolisthes cinctipes]